MVSRFIYQSLQEELYAGKALLVLGPRQAGKTTLLRALVAEQPNPSVWLNCDEPDIRKMLQEPTSSLLRNLVGNATLVIIDEAQRVKNIGLTLKLITDQLPSVQLIATGSSSLELANEINEPLTGRKIEYLLLPFSTKELIQHHGLLEEKRLLSQRLIYGLYPDVVMRPGKERRTLQNLSSSYLYKDIFRFQDVRKPEVLETLLEALALQICSEVSYHELAQTVGIDSATVRRYIDLLEKNFVLFRLRSFSRNLRNELKKSRKIYFYDNGVRNAIINNFQSLDLRTDQGALWENFLVSERQKYLHFHEIHANRYFWRTKQQQEIDYLEDRDGRLYAYEFKWKDRQKTSFPKTFQNTYPDSFTQVVTPENYTDWLTTDNF